MNLERVFPTPDTIRQACAGEQCRIVEVSESETIVFVPLDSKSAEIHMYKGGYTHKTKLEETADGQAITFEESIVPFGSDPVITCLIPYRKDVLTRIQQVDTTKASAIDNSELNYLKHIQYEFVRDLAHPKI